MSKKKPAPPADHPRYRVKLEVLVDLDGPAPANMAEDMTALLTSWSDGRNLYATELIMDGLARQLFRALERGLELEQLAIHGSKMVPSIPRRRGSFTAKHVLEAQKLLEGRNPRIVGSRAIRCAGVETISDEQAREDFDAA